jgi:hypothetical protein
MEHNFVKRFLSPVCFSLGVIPIVYMQAKLWGISVPFWHIVIRFIVTLVLGLWLDPHIDWIVGITKKTNSRYQTSPRFKRWQVGCLVFTLAAFDLGIWIVLFASAAMGMLLDVRLRGEHVFSFLAIMLLALLALSFIVGNIIFLVRKKDSA